MQLRVYGIAMSGVRMVGPIAKAMARVARDRARQLRRAATSVALNIAEGETAIGGNRRARFDTAIGSARESIACLEAAEALLYVRGSETLGVIDRFDHVIATLTRLQTR